MTYLPPSFWRVSAGHAFQKVAAAIREAVACGELQPGDRPPSQRELQDAFEVSKETLLAALRILGAQGLSEGLMEVQPGRHGGAIIRDPDVAARAVAQHLAASCEVVLATTPKAVTC